MLQSKWAILLWNILLSTVGCFHSVLTLLKLNKAMTLRFLIIAMILGLFLCLIHLKFYILQGKISCWFTVQFIMDYPSMLIFLVLWMSLWRKLPNVPICLLGIYHCTRRKMTHDGSLYRRNYYVTFCSCSDVYLWFADLASTFMRFVEETYNNCWLFTWFIKLICKSASFLLWCTWSDSCGTHIIVSANCGLMAV